MPDIGGLAIDRRVEPVRVQGLGSMLALVRSLNRRTLITASRANVAPVGAITEERIGVDANHGSPALAESFGCALSKLEEARSWKARDNEDLDARGHVVEDSPLSVTLLA